MNKNFDTVIGRVKEAFGALTGNKDLKHDGRVDQAKGSVKSAVDRVGDAVSGSSERGEQH